jgi:putative tryptophan/tyrosine transport system substrate-binding protein
MRKRRWRNFMSKRPIGIALSAILFAFCRPVEAQQPTKIPQIGYLEGGLLSAHTSRMEAFRQGLRELGYEEGKNIVIEYRTAAGKRERIPELVAELARLKTDVIIWAAGQEEARQIKTMPVVYVSTSDFVATGLVESLARPGGNITGVTSLAPELSGKRLELLKETVPKLSKVGILFDPGNASNAVELEQLRGAAAGLGVTLRAVEVRGPHDIEKAFARMIRERVDGFSTASGGANNTNRIRITESATKNRLPAVYHQSLFVEGGGLMSYGANLADMYRRAATYVDKILKGRKPADLPVEQPTKFDFVINLKAAKQIGLTIPPNVLVRADRVIK